MSTRTTRASRGEHTAGVNLATPKANQYSIQAQSDIKVRKWRRVLVRLGQIKIPRWIPERDEPTAELQAMKSKKISTKKNKRGRKKMLVKGAKQEVLEDLTFDDRATKRMKTDEDDEQEQERDEEDDADDADNNDNADD